MLLYNVRSNTQLVTKNDVTGDNIQSKALSKQGRDNWDNIFGKKNQKVKQKSMTGLNWDGDEDGEENKNAAKVKETKN